jgi:hypothetical protein
MYEIETNDLEQTMALFTDNLNNKTAQGRMSDVMIAVGGGLYRQITAPVESK